MARAISRMRSSPAGCCNSHHVNPTPNPIATCPQATAKPTAYSLKNSIRLPFLRHKVRRRRASARQVSITRGCRGAPGRARALPGFAALPQHLWLVEDAVRLEAARIRPRVEHLSRVVVHHGDRTVRRCHRSESLERNEGELPV